LASQAGICLENAILYKEITNLFEGFVDASVTAIEARDPTTSGHSRRVATLTVALAQKVDAIDSGPLREVRFSAQDLRQIEYAGVLHDFGKVGVRENVLVKAKKLYDWQRAAIELRFRYIRKSLEVEALREKLAMVVAGVGADVLARADAALAARLGAVDEAGRLVAVANEPTLLEQPVLARLREVARLEYVDDQGGRRPFLEPGEVEALEVARGSLTPAERLEIQSHVTHTVEFLETIPWGRTLKNVPRIAGAHHESLDGRGYPRGLHGAEIPVEARMLTISDIFDALTASDRPYKAAVPSAKALDILASEVKAGRCDPLLFQIFVEAEIWRRVL
jgi:response regulator RpfG family c-di-GMP phosphodiesterase